MDKFQLFLKKNREKRLSIYCLGDILLDLYYQVEVNRISPEFPMPVMSMKRDTPVVKPGGVGNVATQFKHFNVNSRLFCFLNIKLEHVLKQLNVKYCDLMFNSSIKIPVKQRYLEKDIQITRLDIEDQDYGLNKTEIEECRAQLVKELKAYPRQDVTILSDYGKGLFSEENIIKELSSDSITIVDPKYGPLKKWQGCTIFKPNAKEAKELSGLTDWKEQSLYFKRELDCEAVVVTNSGKSVYGIWGDEFFEYFPEEKVSVRSSVGAGDCFVAFLAMAVGHGFRGVDAVEIAYYAGAKYVQGTYNRPITPAELSPNKIVMPEDLLNRDFKLVFQNGCFDILHSGHIQSLKFAAQKGDKLVVALNSDESVKRLKGDSRPIKPLSERMAVMAAIDVVDFVTCFEEDTPLEILQKCKPDVLVKGAQYGKIIGEEIVPETYRAPMVDGVSTTILLGDKPHLCN
jgi:D-beta-D-heptose 7-phosphate kinase/D-beta-D-heptose 1-phosphate adenosyltransferase